MESGRVRVFIVDDNEMTRSLLRMMIHGDAYDVVGDAGTAANTRARVRALRPDMICLDLVLPDADGFDLLDWLVQTLPACSVLMITSSNDLDTITGARAHGARGFIVKPFNPGTVLDTLAKVRPSLRTGS